MLAILLHRPAHVFVDRVLADPHLGRWQVTAIDAGVEGTRLPPVRVA